MSYILEALKKSEQERGTGSSPSVQTIHSAGLQYTQQKKPVWPYILAAIITLNVIALIVFFAPSFEKPAQPAVTSTAAASAVQQSIPAAAVEPAPQVLPRINVAPKPKAIPPAVTQPVAQVQPEPIAEPQAAPAAKTPVVSEDNYQPSISKQIRNDYVSVVDVRDLPLDIQTRIPDMVFSAHVYSSNPQQRSVVINGNFMEQGDMLTSKLRLDEITPDGVVFDFEGTRFRTSVLSNWKIN